MTREEAIAMIDAHKNALLNPVEMLDWTWLRVILSELDAEAWYLACDKATRILSR